MGGDSWGEDHAREYFRRLLTSHYLARFEVVHFVSLEEAKAGSPMRQHGVLVVK